MADNVSVNIDEQVKGNKVIVLREGDSRIPPMWFFGRHSTAIPNSGLSVCNG